MNRYSFTQKMREVIHSIATAIEGSNTSSEHDASVIPNYHCFLNKISNDLILRRGGNRGTWRKIFRTKREKQTTNSTHIWRRRGILTLAILVGGE